MPLFTKIKFSMIKFYETNGNLMSLKVKDLNSVLQFKCKERSIILILERVQGVPK